MRSRRAVAMATAAAFTLISALGASPAAADVPTGVGGLLPGPDLRHGGQATTLYEKVDPGSYSLDEDLGATDIGAKAVTYLLNILMSLLVVFVRGCITLTQWVFNLNLWPDMSGGVGRAVGGLADSVFWPLLPVVLAIGGLAAWTAHKRDGSGLTDFVWLVATVVLGISFVTRPVDYLSGVDRARVAVSSGVMSGLAGGVADTPQGPVPYPVLPADVPGADPHEVALRRASDSIWRTYVVTPWCVADLGSVEACRKYGLLLLSFGEDNDARKAFAPIQGDKQTREWVTGHQVGGRAGVVLLALLTAIPFAVLLLFLGLAALIAAFSVVALGILGPLFLLCWPIRGRPRQIGARWLEALVGAALQGVAVTAVLGVTLVVSSLVVRLADKYGYALVSLLNIAATMTAFRYRRMLEGILGTAMPGAASPLVGLGAMWGLQRIARRVGSGWRLPRPAIHSSAQQPERATGRSPIRTLSDRLRPLPPSGPAGDRSPLTPRGPRPALPGQVHEPASEPLTARPGRPALDPAPRRTAVSPPPQPRPLTASSTPATDQPAATTVDDSASSLRPASPGHRTFPPEHVVRHTPDLPPGPPARRDRRRPARPKRREHRRVTVHRSLPPVIDGTLAGPVHDVVLSGRTGG